MIHRATDRFRQCCYGLPGDTRKLADKSFGLLKKNPRRPSLRFKKLGELWSVRVGQAHRALAVEDGPDFIWVWIGAHAEYEMLLKGANRCFRDTD